MSAGGAYLLSLGLLGSASLAAACAGPDATELWGLGESSRFFADPGEATTTLQREGGPLTLAVPVGVGRNRLALFAREDVSVGAGASIRSTDTLTTSDFAMGALGGVHVERGANVGPIYSVAPSPVRLDDGVVVHGFVKAAGEVAAQPTASVTRGIWEHASGGIDEFSWWLSAPGALQDVERSRSGDATALLVQPGAYPAVVVESGSVTRFTAGTYFIDSLRIERGGVLAFENAWGPVRIWVRQTFVLDGALRDYFLGPNVFFGYLGEQPMDVNAPLRGTLYAPNASVTLAATESEHGGAVFARNIRLQPGAKLEHRVFVSSPDTNSPLTLCRACLLELSTVQCCDTTPVSRSDVESSATCLATCASGQPSSDLRCISRCARHEERSAGACADNLVSSLARCQLRQGYRASTCLDLDYVRLEEISCGG